MQSKIYLSFLFLLAFGILGFVMLNKNERQLIEIAKNYKTYSQDFNGRIVVTDSSKYKWSVYLCAYMGEDYMGYHTEIDSSFFSNADSIQSPHGNKLYKLFVKDQKSYDYIFNDQPLGQTLVKETWNVRKVPNDSLSYFKDAMHSKNDGFWYKPTTVSQLFIMYKETPSEKNDKGWVYGIVDLEKKGKPKVLSQGNLSSCIACHKGTKYDRLFGNQ